MKIEIYNIETKELFVFSEKEIKEDRSKSISDYIITLISSDIATILQICKEESQDEINERITGILEELQTIIEMKLELRYNDGLREGKGEKQNIQIPFKPNLRFSTCNVTACPEFEDCRDKNSLSCKRIKIIDPILQQYMSPIDRKVILKKAK